jgi:hypothetical protein
VVAVILVVFYGWSQRGWLANVADIESRDVDMQSQQPATRLRDRARRPVRGMGDYAIWTETAEFARGNRPISLRSRSTREPSCGSTSIPFLVLDRNLETRASLALDANAGQEYEIPPDSELLAVIKQAVTSSQLNINRDSVRGIVQRARGPRYSPCVRSSTARAMVSRKAGSPSPVHSRRPSWNAWADSRRGRSRASRWRASIAPEYPPRCATGSTTRR